MNKNGIITIGLPKGKMLKTVVGCFESKNLWENIVERENIYYFDEASNIKFVVLRNRDVVTALNRKDIDVAFGSDIYFLDDLANANFYKIKNLDVKNYRLSLITNKNKLESQIRSIICPFPNFCSQFLKPDIEMIKYTGSLEVFLILNKCDGIIDIINTGKTLLNYNLHEMRKIIEISHGIWILKDNEESVNYIIKNFEALSRHI